jgi:hypothetical protein
VFLVLITNVLGLTVIFLVSSFYITYEYCSEGWSDIIKRSNYRLDEKQLAIMVYCIWFFSTIVSLFMILDLNLLIFHLWLIKKGMSTYDYILKRRDNKGIKIFKVKRKKSFAIAFKHIRICFSALSDYFFSLYLKIQKKKKSPTESGGKSIDEMYEEESHKSVNLPLSPKTTDDSKPYSLNITPTTTKIEDSSSNKKGGSKNCTSVRK